ncbi:hypothetical protein CC2G_003876 [Coprinopsis cinerea AmutBmut pab1-1]|nr:hypothetical protein CC2G_003876 [Coprinopsis cinerea AmutBmut pab1-1]
MCSPYASLPGATSPRFITGPPEPKSPPPTSEPAVSSSSMGLSFDPVHLLGFKKPFTVTSRCNLAITNPNAQPFVFKVKTTHPDTYFVIPCTGRVDPGKTISLTFSQASLKQEPPEDARCKAKFLILHTVLTPEMEKLWATGRFWKSAPEGICISEHMLRAMWPVPTPGAW